MIVVTKSEIRDRFYPAKRDEMTWKRYSQSCRVYWWFEKETVLDHLWNRHNEPWQEVKKVLPNILKDLGVSYKALRWNQKAGCSCGCSPGFILVDSNLHCKDIYLMLRLEADGHDKIQSSNMGQSARIA